MTCDKECVKVFLSYFGIRTPDSLLTFGWEDSVSQKFLPGFASGICTRKEVFPAYKKILSVYSGSLPDFLPCLHITLNETKLSSSGTFRSTKDISSARVLCVDVDRELDRSEAASIRDKIRASLVVESSPGRYHFYLRLAPGMNLERWSQLQLGLACSVDGDLGRSHVTSTIRVAGFERLCKSGARFVPRVVYREREPEEWAEKELLSELEWLREAIEKGLSAKREHFQRIIADARKYKSSGTSGGTGGGGGPLEGPLGRNSALYFAVSDFVATSGAAEEEALEYSTSLNSRFEEPLTDREVESVVFRAWKKGISKYERLKLKLDSELKVLESSSSASDPNFSLDSALPSANGHGKPVPLELRKSLLKRLPKNIVESLSYTAKALISDEERWLNAFQIIDRAIASRDTRILAKFLKAGLEEFGGRYTASGALSLFIRGINRWGREVFHVEHISREQFEGLTSNLLLEMQRRGQEIGKAVKERLKERDKNSKGFERVAIRLSEAPFRDTFVNQVSRKLVSEVSIAPETEIQPPWLIVFQDGVLDVRSGTFAADNLAPLRFSNPIACRYLDIVPCADSSPDSESSPPYSSISTPVFDKYLVDWFGSEDESIRKFMLKWYGYCMTTDTAQQSFCFFSGPAGAGKGSVAQILCGLVGDGNFCSLPYDGLERPFSLSAASGRLVVVIDEAEGDSFEHRKRMAMVKKLTGGEAIQVERKYRDPSNAVLPGKLIMQANRVPAYLDRGGAISGRMLPVAFSKSYRASGTVMVKIPSQVILEAEGDAIGVKAALAWVEGYAELVKGVDPFRVEIPKSSALKLGIVRVTSTFNISDRIIKEFLRPSESAKTFTSRKALSELYTFVYECAGLHDERIRREDIPEYYAEVINTFSSQGAREIKRRGIRGISNVYICGKKLLKSYPGLVDTPREYINKYPELIKELGIDNPSHPSKTSTSPYVL
jgi:hypothetical protein